MSADHPGSLSHQPAAGSPPRKPAPVETKDSLREVVETIVFVVVLVLLLKSFAAEAFVIPTGSMAETLYGYQKLVKCPECALEFPVNCSEEVEHSIEVKGCVCPSCRLQIDLSSPPQPNWFKWLAILAGALAGGGATGWLAGRVIGRKDSDSAGSLVFGAQIVGAGVIGVVLWLWTANAGAARAHSVDSALRDRHIVEAGCNSGDRVLVAKFLWDTHLRDLERWDVGVFKFPEEPQRQQTPKNYIKRVIGLPTETIGILGGDLYVAENLDYGPPVGEERELPLRRQTHKNDPRARQLLEEGSPVFKILRKPPDKILAMRRPVFDNEHQARDLLTLLPPRWAPERDDAKGSPEPPEIAYIGKRELAKAEGIWAPAGPYGFRSKGGSADVAWLRYRHLLSPQPRPVEPIKDLKCELIKDVMGYNNGLPPRCSDGENWVGDLILDFDVTVEQADGELVLELSKGVDRFQARWQLPAGTCTLVRLSQGGSPQELDKKPTALTKPGTYRLRFANVDERLTVWVDGKLPFGDGVSYEAPREDLGGGRSRVVRGNNERNDYEPVSIGVRGAAVTVQKMKLWRDTYYTNMYNVETLYVQPGHYLCMGDNSPCSSDSRSWGHEDHPYDRQGGLVPERLLLGRALLVYWPASRFGPIK
jgi:signal peptidase I